MKTAKKKFITLSSMKSAAEMLIMRLTLNKRKLVSKKETLSWVKNNPDKVEQLMGIPYGGIRWNALIKTLEEM